MFCVYQQLVSRVLLDETLMTAAQPKIRKLINKNRKQFKIYVYKSLSKLTINQSNHNITKMITTCIMQSIGK